MRLIRSQSAAADDLTGFKKSQRAARIKDGLLPPPIKLGATSSAFLEHELVAVIAARARGAGDDEVKALVKRLIAERASAQAA